MNTTLVRDIMSKDIVTVRSFAPFRRIAAVMLSRGIGAVLVVDTGIARAAFLMERHAATQLVAKPVRTEKGG